MFLGNAHYGLSFLSDAQQDVSNRFAVFPEGRFQGVDWTPGAETGVPILTAAIGWMECATRQVVEAGDHLILLAEVLNCEASEGGPLLYFSSGYRRLQ